MTSCLYLLSQAVHLWYYPMRWSEPDVITDTIFFSPFIHINQFLIGMAGAYVFMAAESRFRSRVMPVILFIAIVALIAFKPDNISYVTGLIAPLFIWFIISVAANDPRFLNTRPLVFLGEISYGIYILQQPVYRYLAIINDRFLHMPPAFFFYSSVCILILVASISYYAIELPLRKAIGGKVTGPVNSDGLI